MKNFVLFWISFIIGLVLGFCRLDTNEARFFIHFYVRLTLVTDFCRRLVRHSILTGSDVGGQSSSSGISLVLVECTLRVFNFFVFGGSLIDELLGGLQRSVCVLMSYGMRLVFKKAGIRNFNRISSGFNKFAGIRA